MFLFLFLSRLFFIILFYFFSFSVSDKAAPRGLDKIRQASDSLITIRW